MAPHCFKSRQCYNLLSGLKRVPDVKLSARSSSAGVIQSDAHQDRLSEAAQRNIHLEMDGAKTR